MTIGWPKSCDTWSSTTRLTVSAALPAKNGLTTRIGRVGHESSAMAGTAGKIAAPKITPLNARRDSK
jgi:hypothetical protein